MLRSSSNSQKERIPVNWEAKYTVCMYMSAAWHTVAKATWPVEWEIRVIVARGASGNDVGVQ